jgi:hypothetical protein
LAGDVQRSYYTSVLFMKLWRIIYDL